MNRWLVRNAKTSVAVEGSNWLWALSRAQEDLGLPNSAYADLYALSQDDGGLQVRMTDADPVVLYPLRDEEMDQMMMARLATLRPDRLDFTGAPDKVQTTLAGIVHDIVTAPSTHEALRLAIEATTTLHHCEAASVLLEESLGLRFVDARGPHAGSLRNYVLKPGVGIAGFVHETGHAVLLNDLTRSGAHLHALDAETGYRPIALLAVPIIANGEHYGVLELLESDHWFETWEIPVARALAAAVGGAIARHGRETSTLV